MVDLKDKKAIALWSMKGLSARQLTARIIFASMILCALIIGAICLRNAIRWIDKPFPGFLINQRMVVGYIGQYYWTGTQGGLKNPDKILKANDRVLSSAKDLEKIVSNVRIGDPVKYAIEREGKVVEVTIPTMRYSLSGLIMTFGIFFLLGLLYVMLGGTVFILKPNEKVSWVFFIACFLQGISSFASFDMETTHFGFVRAYLFIDAFLPAVVLHLSFLFPEKWKFVERHPRVQYIPYVVSLALAIPIELAYPGPSFSGIYRFALLYLIIGVLAFILSIVRAYFKKTSLLARQRAKVVFFGSLLALPIPALAPLVAFLGGTVGGTKILTNFSSIPIMIFPASIAYAIAKHNLFDVDVYIKRAVGYALMTILVGGAYFSMQVAVRRLILQPVFGDYAEEVYPILFALLIVLLFNPIRNRIQKVVDRIFYRLEYDYQETIQRISGTMRYLQSLDQIRQKIVDTILGVMFIDSCGIILANAEKNAYEGLNISYDYPITKLGLPTHDPLIQEMAEKKKEVTIYDIQEDPSYEKDREAFKKVFKQLKATLIVPLIYEDRLTGVISLGSKKSGKFYRREDINLLKTLANQGAVAIENARLFQENIEKSRMEEELKIAHNLQTSMLPDRAPTIEGFSIAARSIPAREVGGDFYDFIEIAENGAKRLGIVVGDVSGKAVSGALVMAASRSIFRVLTETNESVEEVMNRANARLHRDVKKGMFVALLYAVLNPREKTLTLSNAGQIQPILCSSEKPKAEYIDSEGDRFPLGIVKDCHYQETRVSLKQGDILVFSTDGIVEAVNEKRELYGFERFLASIEEGRGLNADELLEKLIKDVTLYVGKVEQHDDLTAVVVRVD
jgi:serine phosphatase RsbU (regulator of sigma subunit)